MKAADPIRAVVLVAFTSLIFEFPGRKPLIAKHRLEFRASEFSGFDCGSARFFSSFARTLL